MAQTISLVGVSNSVTSTSSTITPSTPSGYVAGDVCYVLLYWNSSGSYGVAPPSGWNKISEYNDTNTGGSDSMAIFGGYAVPPAFHNPGTSSTAVSYAFSSNASTTLLDAHTYQPWTNTGTSPTGCMVSITPTNNAPVIAWICCASGDVSINTADGFTLDYNSIGFGTSHYLSSAGVAVPPGGMVNSNQNQAYGPTWNFTTGQPVITGMFAPALASPSYTMVI